MSAEAQQFAEAIREALSRRLEAVSLKLLDIGLRDYTPEVITPGTDQFIFLAWVARPATGEVKVVATRIGVELGHTTVDDVDPMAGNIVKQLVEQFYGEGS